MRKLIYSTVFYNSGFIYLIDLLLKSYKMYGEPDNDTDYLVLCDRKFKRQIDEIMKKYNIIGFVECLECTTRFEASCARLHIFNCIDISKYDKILYLDCDILIKQPINNILDMELDDKLYATKEGNTNGVYHGSTLWNEKTNPNISAFSSGVLLFKNTLIMKKLFNSIIDHIKVSKHIPPSLDQSFIIFSAINNDLYNNTLLDKTKVYLQWGHELVESSVLTHFVGGGIGNSHNKYNRMKNNIC